MKPRPSTPTSAPKEEIQAIRRQRDRLQKARHQNKTSVSEDDPVNVSFGQVPAPPSTPPPEPPKIGSPPVVWSQPETALVGACWYEAPGTLDGIPVNALPDSGSTVNALSEDFVRRSKIPVTSTKKELINLLGGHKVESVGYVTAEFKFDGTASVFQRVFHVLRQNPYDVILGKSFLIETRTLTEFLHSRIVTSIRPCVKKGNRLFILGESTKEKTHIRCTVNGSAALAFPDLGSELMLVSGDFARWNKLKVHSEAEHRREVKLINGSTMWTDGMVLNATLEFDIPPYSSLQSLDYKRYLDFIASFLPGSNDWTHKAPFICDLHVIEDLPHDIILSGEFIVKNEVFTKFESLFCDSMTAPQEEALMFIRKHQSEISWYRRWWNRQSLKKSPAHSHRTSTWEERWGMEEERRIKADWMISQLSEPRRTQEHSKEKQLRAEWDRKNPRERSA
ncbi:hypothetical protein QBC35DRAFT_463116 [Podospora australis]|uniref:Uncharacterized protein n=1 Tax=Podospora australis TaxID=1536484 RepID=A0AAN7AIS8_9PEZI|nr:hypothetical protein QBC35DRAFT_463116 [Podospora australis]